MNEETINLSDYLGYMELKQFEKFENGRMVTYGYSIKFDRNGEEVSRTEPSFLSSIGYDSGTPFTESEYYRIKHGLPTSEPTSLFNTIRWWFGSVFG